MLKSLLTNLPTLTPERLPMVALLLTGGIAVIASQFSGFRLDPPEMRAANVIRVTSGEDEGPGSLREAILAADRAEGRARVILGVREVVLKTPLPPLINRDGVIIDGADQACEIDATNLPDGPVLDLSSPNSLVSGLRIRGAAGPALLIRASGNRLMRVTVQESEIGVFLAEGGDDLVVQDSQFDSNVTGVHISRGALRVIVRDSFFGKHSNAAIWAVAPAMEVDPSLAQIEIGGNTFEDNATGVVMINMPGRIERNHFTRSQKDAVYIAGAGIQLRSNRIRSGRGNGIHADSIEGALIEDNEVDHNCLNGVVVREGRNTVVQFNRVYDNAFGVVVLLGSNVSPIVVADNLVMQQQQDGLSVIGGYAIIRSNRILQNAGAGLRISDFVSESGETEVAGPLLYSNIVSGNGSDEPVRGQFLAAEPGAQSRTPADCPQIREARRRTIPSAGGGVQ